MTEYALPCLVCGKALRNVHYGAENQPEDGVCAIINGNYGSTVFDPFDGTHLEIAVCDICLVVAGDTGRVLSGRKSRPVSVDGLMVGYEELDTPLVQWDQGTPNYDDICELYREDFEPGAEPLPKSIHIRPESLDAALKLLAADGE